MFRLCPICNNKPKECECSNEQYIDYITKEIQTHMGWSKEKVNIWLNEKNPTFSSCKPIDLIKKGKAIKLINTIIKPENPS